MSSMTQLRRQVARWQGYALRTDHVSPGHVRALARLSAERGRRAELAARRWWPR